MAALDVYVVTQPEQPEPEDEYALHTVGLDVLTTWEHEEAQDLMCVLARLPINAHGGQPVALIYAN